MGKHINIREFRRSPTPKQMDFFLRVLNGAKLTEVNGNLLIDGEKVEKRFARRLFDGGWIVKGRHWIHFEHVYSDEPILSWNALDIAMRERLIREIREKKKQENQCAIV